MANGSNGAVDRYSEEYFKSLLPPQKEDPAAPAAAAATTTPASDQWLTGQDEVSRYMRYGGIYTNQLATGLAEDAALLPRVGMEMAHVAAPNYIGDPPDWLTTEGIQRDLTLGGLTPQTPGERMWAAAGEAGGNVLPFAALGRNPAMVARASILGAGLQGTREAGFPPWLTDTLGVGGGAFFLPGGGNAGRTASTLASREPGVVAGLRAGDVLGSLGTAAGTALGSPMLAVGLGTAGKIVGAYGPAIYDRLKNAGPIDWARRGVGALFGAGMAGETTAPPGGQPTISVPNPLFPQP